jgi:hypothetical protein
MSRERRGERPEPRGRRRGKRIQPRSLRHPNKILYHVWVNVEKALVSYIREGFAKDGDRVAYIVVTHDDAGWQIGNGPNSTSWYVKFQRRGIPFFPKAS